jgi:hypothetical protein
MNQQKNVISRLIANRPVAILLIRVYLRCCTRIEE